MLPITRSSSLSWHPWDGVAQNTAQSPGRSESDRCSSFLACWSSSLDSFALVSDCLRLSQIVSDCFSFSSTKSIKIIDGHDMKYYEKWWQFSLCQWNPSKFIHQSSRLHARAALVRPVAHGPACWFPMIFNGVLNDLSCCCAWGNGFTYGLWDRKLVGQRSEMAFCLCHDRTGTKACRQWWKRTKVPVTLEFQRKHPMPSPRAKWVYSLDTHSVKGGWCKLCLRVRLCICLSGSVGCAFICERVCACVSLHLSERV